MKKSISYRVTQGDRIGKSRLIVATFVVLLIMGIDFLSGGFVRSYVRDGASSVFLWGDSLGTAIGNSGVLSSRRALESQNRSLSERLSQLEEQSQSYQALKSENEALRSLVNVAQSTASESGRGVTAPIVSSVRSSPYGTFLIGAGTADGIVSGSYVLTGEGVMIGIVRSGGTHTSVVSEIFAPGASEEAVINGTVVVIGGSGAGNAYAKVPRGIPIVVGDPVVSPRYGSRTIGIVGNVASSSASASQDVYIRIPVNFSSERYVYIIPSNN